MSIRIDEAACTGCGCCVLSCPEGAIAIRPPYLARVDSELCADCLACIGYCPTDALAE